MRQQSSKIFTNDRCVGCNLCISNCPCEEANVAVVEDGHNKIYIDPDKCIVCGNCVRNCTHNARDFGDDTEQFFSDLRAGKEISVIVAPSIRTNFAHYGRLLGFLKERGARALYDTSFGADICTWAYLRHLDKTGERGVISQPCPAIVNYVERYAHGLLGQLAPIHSPAMCTAIYMRRYRQVPGAYAFLSPCIAKRDEFTDENTGREIGYNITFQKLMAYLDENHIDYQASAEAQFDNEQHGLGAVYPTPGGLRTNVEAHVPNAWVFQVEGQPHACHFLKAYETADKGDSPLLIDILNCQHGCNVGTGALRDETETLEVARTLHHVAAGLRPGGLRRKRPPGPDFARLDRELHLADFMRGYQQRALSLISVSDQALEEAFQALHKNTDDKRQIDCRACGYASCRHMAQAVAKGINHAENCVEYIKAVLGTQREETKVLLKEREIQAEDLRVGVQSILGAIGDAARQTDTTRADVASIASQVRVLSRISGRLAEQVVALREEIDKYDQVNDEIIQISRQSVILSLNAAIEAAHAGDIGQGFAAVADQMKTLANTSQHSATSALANKEVVAPLLREVNDISNEVLGESGMISVSVASIMEAVEALLDIQRRITNAAEQINAGDSVLRP